MDSFDRTVRRFTFVLILTYSLVLGLTDSVRAWAGEDFGDPTSSFSKPSANSLAVTDPKNPSEFEATSQPAPTIPLASLKRTYPQARGRVRWARLSPEERAWFLTFYNQAHSDSEKFYLIKALGMCHPLVELESFADAIRGKSYAWIRNNLKLTNNTRFQGIKQQWSSSCNPAIIQALLGELDPIYAYQIHQDNPYFNDCDDYDAMCFNPKLAWEQKRMLECPSPWGPGGVAVPRKVKGGKGRPLPDLLNQYTPRTGLEFTWKAVTASYPVSQALQDLDLLLSKQIPVPLHVSDCVSNHSVLAVAKYKWKKGTVYVLHDPWTGRTVARTAEHFLQRCLDLSDNPYFTGLYLPAIKNL